MNTDTLFSQICAGDRAALGRGITIVESSGKKYAEARQQLLANVSRNAGKSVRIGVTGVPGVGKSTFIESFGLMLIESGHRVAILAVDPSSDITGGAILGDKTRMADLSRHPSSFIRPTASSGVYGGVAANTYETVLLCESAGYDVIIIETVGVGQSEAHVRALVDHFLLLMHPGAGDSLQGIKRGIMELADQIVINKADGANLPLAEVSQNDYRHAMQFMHPVTCDWEVPVLLCSSANNTGLDTVWQNIERFMRVVKQNGVFSQRRHQQKSEWFQRKLKKRVWDRFFSCRNATIMENEKRFLNGECDLEAAIEEVLEGSSYESSGRC